MAGVLAGRQRRGREFCRPELTHPLRVGTDIVRERAAINTALERNLLKTLTNTDIMEKSSLLIGGIKTHQSSWIFNAFNNTVPYHTKTVPKNVTTHRCLHWRRDKVNATEGKIILKMMSSLKNNYFKMQ
ncbi:uncharacterized protein LJ206_014585 isoform 2-T2 [Theristicus caerulescens]